MTGNVFNILDYGAKGDGAVNCTEPIQKALDDAALYGGKVTVPPGTYRTGTLRLGQGVTLEGTSAWSFRDFGASVLELCDDKTDRMLDITDAFGCAVAGMSLNGKNLGENIHGVLLSRKEYNGGKKEDTPLIDNCRIGSFTGDGVRLDKIWCFSIRHSMLCFNAGAGLYIDGWDGFILDNWFSGNQNGGIDSTNVAASLTVTGNRVEWNGKFGFRFIKGDSYNIIGNFFDRSFGPALILGENADSRVNTVTVTGNIFRRSGAADSYDDECLCSHLYLKGCENTVVTGNAFRAGENDGGGGRFSPDYGIVIGNIDSCVIRDNVLKNGYILRNTVAQNRPEDSVVEGNIGCSAIMTR